MPNRHWAASERPGANQTIKAKDFAAAKLEADIGEFRRVRETFDFQDRLADGKIALGENLVDRAADHQSHEIGFPDAGNAAFADLLAVAQAHEGVGDAKNFIEFVRDEEDRAAFGL